MTSSFSPNRAAFKLVVPAKAGTQWRWSERHWIPAFAGITDVVPRE